MSEITKPASRLAGAELEAFYAQGIETQRRKNEATRRKGWFPWYLLVILVVGWGLPQVQCVNGALLGFWLALGRGGAHQRLGIALLLILPTQAWTWWFLAIQLGLIATSAVLTGGVASLISWLGKAPTRRPQFTLWEIGILTLAVGIFFGVVRFMMLHDQPGIVRDMIGLSIFASYFSSNVVLACLPVIFPPAYRTGKVWKQVALQHLLVIPGLECVFIFRVFPPFDPYLPSALIVLAHWFGLLLVWGVIFSLERKDYFRDVDSPRTEETP